MAEKQKSDKEKFLFLIDEVVRDGVFAVHSLWLNKINYKDTQGITGLTFVFAEGKSELIFELLNDRLQIMRGSALADDLRFPLENLEVEGVLNTNGCMSRITFRDREDPHFELVLDLEYTL